MGLFPQDHDVTTPSEDLPSVPIHQLDKKLVEQMFGNEEKFEQFVQDCADKVKKLQSVQSATLGSRAEGGKEPAGDNQDEQFIEYEALERMVMENNDSTRNNCNRSTATQECELEKETNSDVCAPPRADRVFVTSGDHATAPGRPEILSSSSSSLEGDSSSTSSSSSSCTISAGSASPSSALRAIGPDSTTLAAAQLGKGEECEEIIPNRQQDENSSDNSAPVEVEVAATSSSLLSKQETIEDSLHLLEEEQLSKIEQEIDDVIAQEQQIIDHIARAVEKSSSSTLDEHEEEGVEYQGEIAKIPQQDEDHAATPDQTSSDDELNELKLTESEADSEGDHDVNDDPNIGDLDQIDGEVVSPSSMTNSTSTSTSPTSSNSSSSSTGNNSPSSLLSPKLLSFFIEEYNELSLANYTVLSTIHEGEEEDSGADTVKADTVLQQAVEDENAGVEDVDDSEDVGTTKAISHAVENGEERGPLANNITDDEDDDGVIVFQREEEVASTSSVVEPASATTKNVTTTTQEQVQCAQNITPADGVSTTLIDHNVELQLEQTQHQGAEEMKEAATPITPSQATSSPQFLLDGQNKEDPQENETDELHLKAPAELHQEMDASVAAAAGIEVEDATPTTDIVHTFVKERELGVVSEDVVAAPFTTLVACSSSSNPVLTEGSHSSPRQDSRELHLPGGSDGNAGPGEQKEDEFASSLKRITGQHRTNTVASIGLGDEADQNSSALHRDPDELEKGLIEDSALTKLRGLGLWEEEINLSPNGKSAGPVTTSSPSAASDRQLGRGVSSEADSEKRAKKKKEKKESRKGSASADSTSSRVVQIEEPALEVEFGGETVEQRSTAAAEVAQPVATTTFSSEEHQPEQEPVQQPAPTTTSDDHLQSPTSTSVLSPTGLFDMLGEDHSEATAFSATGATRTTQEQNHAEQGEDEMDLSAMLGATASVAKNATAPTEETQRTAYDNEQELRGTSNNEKIIADNAEGDGITITHDQQPREEVDLHAKNGADTQVRRRATSHESVLQLASPADKNGKREATAGGGTITVAGSSSSAGVEKEQYHMQKCLGLEDCNS